MASNYIDGEGEAVERDEEEDVLAWIPFEFPFVVTGGLAGGGAAVVAELPGK